MSVMAPACTAVEMLRFQPASPRGAAMFEALRRTAPNGVSLTTTDSYHGGSDLLMLWGPGAPNRFESMRRQVAAGGHVVCWDLGYWSRETKIRVSIDAAHPQAWVMRKPWPSHRFASDPVAVGDAWDPTGPVIIAGLGRKARVQYGESVVLAWEASMITACRARWPSRLVLYRPKQADAPIPPDVARAASLPIEHVLAGASLVVTWHSNVAVDAIRFGIPVICRDGAAAAICPSTLGLGDPRPLDLALRDRFLAHLAWFQWAPSEAAGVWAFLAELLA